MSVVPTATLESLTIDQVLARIRIDPATGKGSVLDVIQLITAGKHYSTWTIVAQKLADSCHYRPKRHLLGDS